MDAVAEPASGMADVVDSGLSVAGEVLEANGWQWGNLKPAQKGEIRNPLGNQTAGASVADWFNALAGRTPDTLRRMLRDRAAPVSKIQAIHQHLDAIARYDIADVQSILDGESLAAARLNGVDTSIIKKWKQQKDGSIEIELKPESRGESLDRIMDRTEGKAIARGMQLSLTATMQPHIVDAVASDGTLLAAAKALVMRGLPPSPVREGEAGRVYAPVFSAQVSPASPQNSAQVSVEQRLVSTDSDTKQPLVTPETVTAEAGSTLSSNAVCVTAHPPSPVGVDVN